MPNAKNALISRLPSRLGNIRGWPRGSTPFSAIYEPDFGKKELRQKVVLFFILGARALDPQVPYLYMLQCCRILQQYTAI